MSESDENTSYEVSEGRGPWSAVISQDQPCFNYALRCFEEGAPLLVPG